MATGFDTFAAGFIAHKPNLGIIDEGGEQTHRIRSTTDARDRRIRKPTLDGQDLLAGLASDHAVEVAHHPREGSRPGDRAQKVVRGVDVGNPIAHRFIDGIFESLTSRGDGNDGCAEQLHSSHIESLALGVFVTHVNNALQTHQRCGSCRSNTVLASAGLGDDSALAHASGEEGLTKNVVDLVRSGVVEILALQVETGTTTLLFKAPSPGQWRGPTRVVAFQFREFGREGRIY